MVIQVKVASELKAEFKFTSLLQSLFYMSSLCLTVYSCFLSIYHLAQISPLKVSYCAKQPEQGTRNAD